MGSLISLKSISITTAYSASAFRCEQLRIGQPASIAFDTALDAALVFDKFIGDHVFEHNTNVRVEYSITGALFKRTVQPAALRFGRCIA